MRVPRRGLEFQIFQSVVESSIEESDYRPLPNAIDRFHLATVSRLTIDQQPPHPVNCSGRCYSSVPEPHLTGFECVCERPPLIFPRLKRHRR